MAQLKRLGFGLQALMVLASHSNQLSSTEIAASIGCEPTALRKILSQLVESGLLEVKQGRGGGYCLGKRPEEITLAEVYTSVHDEEPQWNGMLNTTGENLFGRQAHQSFRSIMKDINKQVYFVLGNYTVSDLID